MQPEKLASSENNQSQSTLIDRRVDGDTILVPTQRFAFIDLLEALAISFVIIYHVGMYPKDILASPSFITHFNYGITSLLSTCVPIFFLVNGFLLFGKPLDLKRHIRKIVFIILILLFWRFAIPLALMPITGQEYVLDDYLKIGWNFKVEWNNQLWFLETLVCLYIAFPLLKLAFDKRRNVFIFFLVVCAICTFGNTLLDEFATMARASLTGSTKLVSFSFFKGINLFAGINGYALVYFCVGGLVRDKLRFITSAPVAKRIIISALVAVISMLLLTLWGEYASFLTGKLWDNVYAAYSTVFTFATTLSLFVICLSYKGRHRVIYGIVTTISKNTMGIFILHYPINTALHSIVPQMFVAGSAVYSMFGLALYDSFILAISLLLTLFLKKIPIIKKLV